MDATDMPGAGSIVHDIMQDLENNPNDWKNKHIDYWTEKDSIDWLYCGVVPEHPEINQAILCGENFKVPGQTLCAMTESDFKSRDETYGEKLYQIFKETYQQVNFVGPDETSFSEGQSLLMDNIDNVSTKTPLTSQEWMELHPGILPKLPRSERERLTALKNHPINNRRYGCQSGEGSSAPASNPYSITSDYHSMASYSGDSFMQQSSGDSGIFSWDGDNDKMLSDAMEEIKITMVDLDVEQLTQNEDLAPLIIASFFSSDDGLPDLDIADSRLDRIESENDADLSETSSIHVTTSIISEGMSTLHMDSHGLNSNDLKLNAGGYSVPPTSSSTLPPVASLLSPPAGPNMQPDPIHMPAVRTSHIHDLVGDSRILSSIKKQESAPLMQRQTNYDPSKLIYKETKSYPETPTPVLDAAAEKLQQKLIQYHFQPIIKEVNDHKSPLEDHKQQSILENNVESCLRCKASTPNIKKRLRGAPKPETRKRKGSSTTNIKTVKSAKPGKRGRRKGQASKGNHLWEFLLSLLQDSKCNPHIIKWEERAIGAFTIVKSEEVARHWGMKKDNDTMTYEKLSRALRHNRKFGYIKKPPKYGSFPKKLCFVFGDKTEGWNDPNYKPRLWNTRPSSSSKA